MLNKCPICSQEMIITFYDHFDRDSEYEAHCRNKCYYEYDGFGNQIYRVVDEEFRFSYAMSEEKSTKESERMNEAIKLEKENNRYIARILSQG